MQSQPAGQALVHLGLDPVDQFQEAPGGERDQHADQRRQDEQDPVALAPHCRARIGRGSGRLTHRRCRVPGRQRSAGAGLGGEPSRS